MAQAHQTDPHPPRTHNCGELRPDDVGREVVLKGWVDTWRNLGGVLFIDIRDRWGLTQAVFSPQFDGEAFNIASTLRNEFVISVKGTIRLRDADTINKALPTGRVEIRGEEIAVLATTEPLPFQITQKGDGTAIANEDLRLKYRYLDLRRGSLQKNILLRHKFYQVTRRYFDGQDFVEVETPILMKSTPEGARDYLVPSRVHPGKFYALPQSPQTYKQILMVSGLDRYFQIVKCFRDEDLRSDRQPEFTQVDVELTFATEEQIYALIEEMMVRVWKELDGTQLETPFKRLTYEQALRRYGSDKPDTRIGLELHNLNECFHGCGFRVFDETIDDGGDVVGFVVPGEGHRGRGAMDRLDKDVVRKKIGAKGLIYFKLPADGSSAYSSVKSDVLPYEYIAKTIASLKARPGDLVLILAGHYPTLYHQSGALRAHLAQEIDAAKDVSPKWDFLWVTDFPLLEWDEKEDRFTAMHHPFTSPNPDDFDKLKSDPANVRARAYDLVLNGMEIGGGSIRIHSPEVQSEMFSQLGIDADEAERRFGFLLEAFRFGAPPHGGIALGVDRIVMLLAGAQSLRDVIAFPKTQSAQELMVSSPDVVDDMQLGDLHIAVVEETDAEPEEKEEAGSE